MVLALITDFKENRYFPQLSHDCVKIVTLLHVANHAGIRKLWKSIKIKLSD